MEFFTSKIFFSDKIKLLIRILVNRHKNLHKRYKSDLNDLMKLTNLRNDFAHKPITIDMKLKILKFKSIQNHRLHYDSITFETLDIYFNKLKYFLEMTNKLEDDLKNCS